MAAACMQANVHTHMPTGTNAQTHTDAQHTLALACINMCTQMYIPTCHHTYPYKCTNTHTCKRLHT